LEVYTRAWRGYTVLPYHGDAVIFSGRDDMASQAKASWRTLTLGEVNVETLEGEHLDFVMDPELVDCWPERLTAVLAACQVEEPEPA
jgi:hypothetical protein